MLLERALGGTATLVLAAVGFALAVGRYDVGGYLWVELAFVVGAVVAGDRDSSRRGCTGRCSACGRCCGGCASSGRCARSTSRCTRSGQTPRLLLSMFALTLVVQAVRVLAIWCAGKAVGVDLSPRPYYVMGPLLFLVMLVPFTVNGLAVRESFFVSFLGTLGVPADRAFATGFLFFVVTIVLALPGAGDRRLGGAARRSPHARAAMSDASVVVVTYNGLPWIEQALASVRGVETVVVDNASTDGTVAFVRERFPDVDGASSRRTAASPPAGTPGSRARADATCCS